MSRPSGNDSSSGRESVHRAPRWRSGRPVRDGGKRTLGRITEITSGSPEETYRLGIQIGRNLPIPGVLLLRGPLGSGKTTLTKGVAVGLGLKDGSQVISPSYTLVNIYAGRCPIYHVDLYRLSGGRDIRSIGLDDFMGIEGVTIIEWSERLNRVPVPATEVDLENAGERTRKLKIRLRGVQKRRSENCGT